MRSIIDEMCLGQMQEAQLFFLELKERLKLEIKEEDKAYENLKAQLSPEDMDFLSKFEDAFYLRHDKEIKLIYQYAFKKGAQLMLEIMGVKIGK